MDGGSNGGAPIEPAPDSPCYDDEKCFLNKASYAAFKGEKWKNLMQVSMNV